MDVVTLLQEGRDQLVEYGLAKEMLVNWNTGAHCAVGTIAYEGRAARRISPGIYNTVMHYLNCEANGDIVRCNNRRETTLNDVLDVFDREILKAKEETARITVDRGR